MGEGCGLSTRLGGGTPCGLPSGAWRWCDVCVPGYGYVPGCVFAPGCVFQGGSFDLVEVSETRHLGFLCVEWKRWVATVCVLLLVYVYSLVFVYSVCSSALWPCQRAHSCRLCRLIWLMSSLWLSLTSADKLNYSDL